MFGMRPEVMTRRAAKAAARREALGFIDPEDWTAEAGTAKRILEEAAAEEAHERDVVEGSAREGSALDG
jgi:hypothetical protein